MDGSCASFLRSEYKFLDQKLPIFSNLWYKSGPVLKNDVFAVMSIKNEYTESKEILFGCAARVKFRIFNRRQFIEHPT